MTNIQTEINRILDARDDSFDAVTEKGVTVPTNATIDDLPDLIRAIPVGAGSAISVVDTLDENGGTIRTITAVSLAGDTVSPSVLLQGYTAHNALGEAIVGTASSSSTTINSLEVTENGTYTAPTGTAYSPVTVNVPTTTINNQNKSLAISPTESAQTKTVTADSGYTGLGEVEVTVGAISSTYVGSGITRKSAATITPTKSQQTIASGTYLTGTQTIAAIPDEYITTTDANATASQINSGATAYVNGTKVTGTQVVQTYYTGSSTPSASLGNDGDLYLKVGS